MKLFDRPWNRIHSDLLDSYYDFTASHFVGRAENMFATHIPVLIGLAKLFPIRTVTEFGCGIYSTLLFLNRRAFPHLTHLYSYEDNQLWIDEVNRLAGPDMRVKLMLAAPRVHSVIDQINLTSSDLIFVDDSVSIDDRVMTIQKISREPAKIRTSLLVIHDYERPVNRYPANTMPNNYRFTALNPNTGLLWNQLSVSRSSLRRLNLLIKRNKKNVDANDIGKWIEIISQGL